jgi:hypothetical protein
MRVYLIIYHSRAESSTIVWWNQYTVVFTHTWPYRTQWTDSNTYFCVSDSSVHFSCPQNNGRSFTLRLSTVHQSVDDFDVNVDLSALCHISTCLVMQQN